VLTKRLACIEKYYLKRVLRESGCSKSVNGGNGTCAYSQCVLLPVSNPDTQDVLVVSDYILSMEMAKHLDERFQLRDHYSDTRVDFISRLSNNANDEDYLKYLRKQISVHYEESSSIISIETQAYSATMAQSINQEVIARSEQLINTLSDRIVNDTLQQAQLELEYASESAKDISRRLSSFAQSKNSINPGVDATSIAGLIGGLEARLAETRALYTEKSAYLRESTAEMRALTNRINGIQKELDRERARLSDNEGVGTAIEEYKPLLIEEELGRQRYGAALKALETARAESQTQKRYLTTFVKPSLPSSATEPKRLLDAVTAIALTFLFYAIFALFRSAIREHIDFAT